MHRLIFYIWFTCIAGCANCSPVTLVKATAEPSHTLKVENNLIITNLKLGGKVVLSLQNCFAERKSSICASIQAEPGTRVRLSSYEVATWVPLSKTERNYKIKSIEYDYVCEELNGERVCSSTEESPTESPTVAVKEKHSMVYQGGLREVHTRAFSPTMEFIGVREKSIGLPWRYIRDYKFILIDDELLNTPPLKAKLPNIWVDGVEYVLPVIDFATVTEEFCRRPELM